MIEKILQFYKSPQGKVAMIAFLLGLALGWFVIGWGIWPVVWTDAGFADLQEDYAKLAIKNAVNAYSATGDQQTALQTYLGFGKAAEGTYLAVKQSGEVSPEALVKFDQLLADNGNAPSDAVVAQPTAETTEGEEAVVVETEDISQPITGDIEEEAAATANNKALNRIGTFIGIFFILFLLGGLVLVYIFLLPEDLKKSIQALFSKTPKPRMDRAQTPEEEPAYLTSMERTEDYDFNVDFDEPFEDQRTAAPSGNAKPSAPRLSPIVRTVNYVHNDAGRSHLDQNFSLKDTDDSGKTVLEYGVAMSDYVEIGGVTYALAFDVYLASHPERRTITRVLVNKDLLDHPEVLQRYEGKGDPIKIDQDYVFQLETAKFRLNGSILTADYVYDEVYGGNYIRAMEVDLLIHYL